MFQTIVIVIASIYIYACSYYRVFCNLPPELISTKSTLLDMNEEQISNALKDIAYSLRYHKFNEWDKRYHNEKPNYEKVGFYKAFPIPRLKSIHWEVYENCYSNFYKCINYLHYVIQTAPFTRDDDLVIYLMRKTSTKYSNESIMKSNYNCKKALLYTEDTGLPFDGPKEKFLWRTSATYYMCWYTMREVPEMSLLGEACDNFANCLDSTFGSRNNDIRANDKLSYACAMYSFCPDPCCPKKHINSIRQCYNQESNPCLVENVEYKENGRKVCNLMRKRNQNFEDLISNKWNVTCNCEQQGFKWDSKFGMCVDVNECITGEHNCNKITEECFNVAGGYQCLCKLGYDADSDQCT